MLALNSITLLINGLTLSLALGFLIILLWHDWRQDVNQFFGVFLIFVVLWNIGSFLLQLSLLTINDDTLLVLAIATFELGFTGSSVSLYVFATVIVAMRNMRFRVFAFSSLTLIVAYRLIPIFASQSRISSDELGLYQFQPLFVLMYFFFNSISLFLTWRYRRKIETNGLIWGIFIFLIGQSLVFVNPNLVVASFSSSISSIGVLVIGFSVIRLQMISPFYDRLTQIETMHQVSLAISSQIAIDTVLDEVAIQASNWLDADAVAIFLIEQGTDTDSLRLESAYNFPPQFRGVTVPFGYGVSGQVAATRKTIFLQNYTQDWRGEDEFSMARQSFGSVICVPLSYASQVIGTLFVVSGKQGRLFDGQDVHLLELLTAQVAVAISHSHLFLEQKALTNQVQEAHSQLDSVLSGTDNPVISLDRRFKITFVNPAFCKLFPSVAIGRSIFDVVPSQMFPEETLLSMVRKIHTQNRYVYETNLGDKVYFCNLAQLGDKRVLGWVIVLNDVTQFKELDRLKSEMIRMASHDLKNPLMGASAYLELLKDETQDQEELQQFVETIQWQLERMNRIIRGILDLDKLNNMSSAMEKCNPEEIATRSVNELTHFIADKGVDLHTEIAADLPEFWGDSDQFTRALVNVLENAVKFTIRDGRVELKVYLENSFITFCVVDNGVGISEDIQSQIFDRFFRGNQPGVEHVTGSGLGLSFVKTILEHHRGHVWFKSEANIGTTFYLSVPSI